MEKRKKTAGDYLVAILVPILIIALIPLVMFAEGTVFYVILVLAGLYLLYKLISALFG